MNNFAPFMGDNHQYIQKTKSDRGNHEEVQDSDRTGMILEKGLPTL
jgi:hypothetical protein